MQDLNIALVQADLVWQDYKANLKRFEKKIAQVPEDTHLIVLPEMFTTGFSMEPDRLSQSMEGKAVSWMKALSQQKQADIVGSLIIHEENSFFNRLIWVQPDGQLYEYNKKHLFRYVGEEKFYTSGDRQLLVDCHGWKIRPFICYDLRFPIWTRNLDNAYDASIFIANWPERRSMHWKALLVARAIENQSFVIGVNRVGVDGNGIRYSGDSCIIDPLGKHMVQVSHEEAVIVETLSYDIIESNRKFFPAWVDADKDLLK